jgi:hypothetical protein
MYCYLFKGAFLPSGSLDGRVWKPSQSARPTGDGLMKRYFYYKEGNVKINRQVIWLTSDENWCFLDYRYLFFIFTSTNELLLYKRTLVCLQRDERKEK